MEPRKHDPPLLLTVAEAVTRSGISRRSLYRLLNERQITARKMGRSTLVETKSLVDYVERLPKY
jgi:excisionase family DNA binding protein